MSFFGKWAEKQSEPRGAGRSGREEREVLSLDALGAVSGGFDLWSADGCHASAEPCNDGYELIRRGIAPVGELFAGKGSAPDGPWPRAEKTVSSSHRRV